MSQAIDFMPAPSLPFGDQQTHFPLATKATAPGNTKDATRDKINNVLIQWQGASAARAIVRADILRFYDDRSIDLEISAKVRASLPKEVWGLLGQKENIPGNLYTIPEE